jgi:NO-binding membrane sensor protein with MHYT domain
VGAVTVGSADLVVKAVQVPAALLLLFGGALGFTVPRWAWVWGLVLGFSVFTAHALATICGYKPPYQVQPNILASLLALIPAMIGSCFGAGLGWAVRKGRIAA